MINSQNRCIGTIVKGIGGFYYVSTGEEIIECHARGKFRKNDLSPIVGDTVTLLLNEDGTGSISTIHERKNFLVRPDVANVDILVLVSAMRSPMPDFMLIDKLLVTAQSKGIECVICLNKTDLAQSDEIEEFASVYKKAQYKVIVASAKTGEGVKEIQSLIKGKTVAFAGLSGVGKSSLLKRITGVDLKTGSVSKIERGKHTTRHVELYTLENGGKIADTPGFSTFETESYAVIPPNELADCFPELREVEEPCRYGDCRHLHEPDCAIRKAVAAGEIPESRYESYVIMLEEAMKQKSWEQKK